ncbi:DUF4956 domain-containing protein [Deinococcus sp. SM5_A1]|uniref:DUF4956 domain-containing protein n=1 Tax=Deinococcus sp. SM5_A1 TaxID=3379094 RepID=UPI00385EA396
MKGLEGLRPEIFALNLIFVLLVTRGLYSRTQQNPDLLFSLLMFSIIIFLVVTVFAHADISIGFGFGLFAVFGILRYRTGAISTRDLTYLFVVVAVAMINGLSRASSPTLLLVNVIVLLTLVVAQSALFATPLASMTVEYENVHLTALAQRSALLDDLRQRTGLDVQDVQVRSVDYVRDLARLQLIYRPPKDSRSYSDIS